MTLGSFASYINAYGFQAAALTHFNPLSGRLSRSECVSLSRSRRPSALPPSPKRDAASFNPTPLSPFRLL